MLPFPFFILAGGYGKRTQPLSFFKPKPMFPLDGEPLIRIMLNQLTQKGFNQGWINLHHLADMLRDCVEALPAKPSLSYIYEDRLSGSRVLREALPHLKPGEWLLTLNGDIFLDIPVEGMLEAGRTADVDGILLVRPNKETNAAYTEILAEDGYFTGKQSHAGRNANADSWMYTGVALFKPPVIEAITEINLFDTLERKKTTFRIKLFPYDGIWLDIGDPKSYRESNFAYKKRMNTEGTNSLSEHVSISPDSIVEHSIVWENTEIKNKSTVRNCILTGNMILDHQYYENQIISGF